MQWLPTADQDGTTLPVYFHLKRVSSTRLTCHTYVATPRLHARNSVSSDGQACLHVGSRSWLSACQPLRL